ncbi:MAG: DUF2284 domain-containing protein [Proteobacteria bacterium]|nr:DUF2284 domain-containing protein [Pseudomonadota bacterium]
MPWSDYQRCPGMETLLNPEPETVACPGCGNEVEIWSDEARTRCPSCRAVVHNRETPRNRALFLGIDSGGGVDLNALLDVARQQGASAAAWVDASAIPVDDELAGHCLEPRCPNYGLSASCPPHVGGPSEFRALQAGMDKALVFKIDVPSEILLSSDRREIGLLVHEIAVEVERAARESGAVASRAFAGGSCKNLFCRDQPDCNVVEAGGPCRNPEKARPSMSGFGIDVRKLVEAAGWKMWEAGGPSGGTSMGTLAGLVLIG